MGGDWAFTRCMPLRLTRESLTFRPTALVPDWVLIKMKPQSSSTLPFFPSFLLKHNDHFMNKDMPLNDRMKCTVSWGVAFIIWRSVWTHHHLNWLHGSLEPGNLFFFSFSSLFKSHSVRCVYKKMGHAIKIYLNCQEMLKHVMCFIMCKHEEMAALEKWKCWRCTPDGGPDLWAWFLHFREWAPVFGTSKIETENQQMKFLKG